MCLIVFNLSKVEECGESFKKQCSIENKKMVADVKMEVCVKNDCVSIRRKRRRRRKPRRGNVVCTKEKGK